MPAKLAGAVNALHDSGDLPWPYEEPLQGRDFHDYNLRAFGERLERELLVGKKLV